MTKFAHYPKTALLFIAPQILITLIFFIWPALEALKQAFFFMDAFGLHSRFAGLSNFLLIFSPDFSEACVVTLTLSFFITLLTMGFGLLVAVLVQGKRKSQSVYRSLMLWPYAVAPAVAAILWRFLSLPDVGWLSVFLHHIGIRLHYLTDKNQSMMLVILASSWQQFSYNFLFYFTALKAIPPVIHEAAMLDGAKGFRRFWQITFPLLSPTTFFLLIINLIYVFFDTFGVIDILTHGGPDGSTATLIYKIYQDGLMHMDLGAAAAHSVIVMILLMGLTILQFRYIERKVHYA